MRVGVMIVLALKPEQIEGILRRLELLHVESADIPSFTNMTQMEYAEDRHRRRSLERLAENVANSIVDIAKILLETSDLSAPNTCRDMVLTLSALGVVDEPLAQRLGNMVRLRSIVAHEYLDIGWANLQRFADGAPATVEEFCAHIERLPAPWAPVSAVTAR